MEPPILVGDIAVGGGGEGANCPRKITGIPCIFNTPGRRDARRGALSRACPDKMGKAIFSRYGDPPRITRGYCSADVARPGTDAILINTKGILRNIGGIVESLFFSDFR